MHGARHAARHRAQRLAAQAVVLHARLPRVRHALHDGFYALGKPRSVVAVGHVRAQVTQRVGQPRAAVVDVFDGMAVLYLADDTPQRIALEHRFAMWVAGLAEPPGTVVLPRLPAAVRVAAVSEPPRKVVLMVGGDVSMSRSTIIPPL